MAFSFPSNPTNNQEYTGPNGIIYTFDGVKWNGSPVSSSSSVRNTVIPDGNSISISVDTTDIAYQNNTQAVGTLAISNPTGTPTDSQKLMLKIKSTNIQTFSWGNGFTGSTDLSLPTASTGGGKVDYVGFIYMESNSKWHLIAKNFGF